MLSGIEAEMVLKDAEFLRYAREIITYHHEKWDGIGYP
jgi:response regulator RpfG family c-di-GMP phosphodiesterase